MLRLSLLALFLPLAIVLACLSPSNSGIHTPAGASTTSSSKSAAEVLHHISAPRSFLSKKALEATVSTADEGALVSPPRRSLNKVPVPPSAPNPGTYIPAPTTSQSAAVGHSTMSPPRRLLNKVPVPPSAPNPGTYIPASSTSQSAAVAHNMSPPSPRRSLKTAADVPPASTANQSAFGEPLLQNASVPASAPNPTLACKQIPTSITCSQSFTVIHSISSPTLTEEARHRNKRMSVYPQS
ncbi:hypothetical protein I3842_03G249300 [Carya illinoinensis]|uniref:Uncharacterized protein n=1 Tax=Carya illinoinensis TaxID=32201 RepID=A0A922JXT2_CARIL|nr:hypothetical protein I3842_03G249300 [Carya illinoinensis]